MKNSAKCTAALLAAILLALTPYVWADATADGVAAFDKGDFDAAARAFDTALAAGPKSAALYYDLGLARQKSGDRAQAALAFRRALTLDPRMVEARMALSDLERSQGVALPRPGWQSWIAEHLSIPALAMAGCVVAWAGSFLLVFAIFRRGRKLGAIFAAIAIVIVGKAIFAAGYFSDPRIVDRDSGVLLDQVSLLSAPADQSTMLSRLPACSPVTILRQSGEWTYCQSATGDKGWAPSAKIAAVVPAA